MPIEGRQPKDCFNEFREHMSKLLAAILGAQHVVRLREEGSPCKAALRLGGDSDVAVKLKAGGGSFYLSLMQSLEARKSNNGYELKTLKYRYAIYASKPDDLTDAIFRWDYSAQPLPNRQCRRHFQIGKVFEKNGKPAAVTLPFNQEYLDLNKLHTPTGFVLVEYVLRFLVTELQLKPANDEWEERLDESEARYREEFSR